MSGVSDSGPSRAEYDGDREMRRLSRQKRNIAQLGAYLLIVVIALYGFYQQDQDNRARCESGDSLRQSVRDTVDGVHDLAVNLTKPPEGRPTPTLTPEQQAERDEFMKTVDKFQKDTKAKIVDNPACDKYKD